MPPSDNTPDFDSMTPEELMAWMETLAERQGAVEGFTTEKRVEIDEVDPTTAEETGPGYIPYGMSEEEWAKRQEKEETEKQARLAERAAQQQAQAAPPPAPVPEPEPVAAAAPAADAGQPDFDSMTPEELMAWMETLAERQGAVEGFTTEKRVDIAEVDPTTAEDTGPGYIPYGMSEEEWAKRQEKEEAEKQARLAERAAQQQAQAAPPAPEPAAEEVIEPVAALDDFAPTGLEGLDFDAPVVPTAPSTETPQEEAGGLDWLENLSSDQSLDFPEMDLSGLGDEIANLDLGGLDAEVGQGADPMDWLQSMSGDEEPASDFMAQPDADVSPTASPDDEDVDPIEWLESLAVRQDNPPGADELMTSAGLDVPVPDEVDTDAPGYEDYAFENTDAMDSVQLPKLEDIDQLDIVADDPDNPVAWLESLAEAQNNEGQDDDDVQDFLDDLDLEPADDVVGEVGDEDVINKLNQGISEPEDIENWMSALLEQGAQRTDVSDYIDEEEEEEPAIAAQIPDWLLEQVGQPPEMGDVAATVPSETAEAAEEEEIDLPPGFEDVEETLAEADIPDWLKEDVGAADDTENIFADDTAVPAASVDEPELQELATSEDREIDTDDPWVQAFEEERTQDEELPAWYRERMAKLQEGAAPVELAPANLEPEATLSPGEPEPLPAWMGGDADDVVVEEEEEVELVRADTSWLTDMIEDSEEPVAVSDEDVPDWLKDQVDTDEAVPAVSGAGATWLDEAEIDPTDTVPDWLLETFGDETAPPAVAQETAAVVQAAPVPAPTPQPAAPVPVSPSPEPAMQIDVAATLQRARSNVQDREIDAALAEYEAVVRANTEIDTVVTDLEDLLKQEQYKKQAPVYRVLGDGLMRQGRLQEALDTYRRALNLL